VTLAKVDLFTLFSADQMIVSFLQFVGSTFLLPARAPPSRNTSLPAERTCKMPAKRKGVAKKANAKPGAGKGRAVEASETPTQAFVGESLRGGSTPQGKKHLDFDMVQLTSGSLCSRPDAEAELRKWDMQAGFGPCMSMSRKER